MSAFYNSLKMWCKTSSNGMWLIMYDYYQEKGSVNNSKDVESQVPAFRTKSSLIKSIQSLRNKNHNTNNGKNPNILSSHNWSNGIKFYKQRVFVYNFLQRPDSLTAIGYHVFVSCIVFTCLVLTVLSTVSGKSLF